MNGRSGQIAFLILLAAVPAFVFYDIGTRFAAEGVASGSAENNAAMYPRLVAIVMAGLIAVQLLRTVLGRPHSSQPLRLAIGDLVSKYWRTTALFVLFLAYIWAFRWFGFVYSSLVFLALAQAILGRRNPLKIALYAGGVTAVIWLAFAQLLNLALPSGDYFG